MSDIKSTRRLQIFISLESAAALNELVEYNHETITRAVEQSLIERQARLPHHAVEDMLGAHGVWPKTRPNGVEQKISDPVGDGSEAPPEDQPEHLEHANSFNDPAREKRKQARKERKAALAQSVARAVKPERLPPPEGGYGGHEIPPGAWCIQPVNKSSKRR